MTKSRKFIDMGISAQGVLFSTVPEGALDVDFALRDSLTKALAKSKDSRYQIAGKIAEATGRNFSKNMLDQYTASNQAYNLYCRDLTAFCAITSTLDPFRVLLEPLGCSVVTPEDTPYVRLARLNQQKSQLLTEISRLESLLALKGGK